MKFKIYYQNFTNWMKNNVTVWKSFSIPPAEYNIEKSLKYKEVVTILGFDYFLIFGVWLGARPLDIHGSRVRVLKKDDPRLSGFSFHFKQYFIDVLWRRSWTKFKHHVED